MGGLNNINRMTKNILKTIPEYDKYERESSWYTLERGMSVKDYLERENGDCRDFLYQAEDKKNMSKVNDLT
jgi:hypothetical protein